MLDIVKDFKDSGVEYVKFQAPVGARYKWNEKRNEYQIKDWYLQDWYKLQDFSSFDQELFMKSQKAVTFNEAKRQQYAKFPFSKRYFFHFKTIPAMKEWGGLTHPPIRNLTLPLHKYDERFTKINYTDLESPYFDPSFQSEVDEASRSELSFGNTVLPLPDREAFSKKLEMIRSARQSIFMSSLVFVCDQSTAELVDRLIEKHQDGVTVKILVDGFISRILNHRKCLKKMRKAGIEVLETRDFFKHKRQAIYHTKTLVIDLEVAIAGGQNMIDADNSSRGTDFKNRDIDLFIQGPLVRDVARQFFENWTYQATLRKGISSLEPYLLKVEAIAQNERLQGVRGKDFYKEILNDRRKRMEGVCRFIKEAPYEDRHTIGKAYLKHLDKVKNHLVITDPVKTDSYTPRRDSYEMFNKLHLKVQDLARDGVGIDYITTNATMAGNENVAMMNERIKDQLEKGHDFLANWSLAKLYVSNRYYGSPHYKNLMKDWLPFKNVHIWKHISFLHSKIFFFDRIVASIGSYNFQHNATDQAYESTVICMDERLNRDLDRLLVEDMANSIPFIFSSLQ